MHFLEEFSVESNARAFFLETAVKTTKVTAFMRRYSAFSFARVLFHLLKEKRVYIYIYHFSECSFSFDKL